MEEPITGLLASRKPMILAPIVRTRLAGSVGGSADILEKVEKLPPRQRVAKGRFYAATSSVIGSIKT